MVAVNQKFTAFDQNEIRPVGFDWTLNLAGGELITAAAFTLSVQSGNPDGSANNRKNGNPVIATPTAIQSIGPLNPGTTYLVVAQIMTNQSKTLVAWALVDCTTPG